MKLDKIERFTLRAYRGCGVQPASFKAGASDWIPEACFWLYTDEGWRRLWVASFAQWLPRAEMTFRRRIDADAWACHLARQLIDRILIDFPIADAIHGGSVTGHIAATWLLIRRMLGALHLCGKKFH